MMEPYLHSPTCLDGMLDNFSCIINIYYVENKRYVVKNIINIVEQYDYCEWWIGKTAEGK
jgi:hypothetical protein